MNIVLDFGNSLLKVGTFYKRKLTAYEVFKVFDRDEIDRLIKENQIESGIISSVVSIPGSDIEFLRKKLKYFVELSEKIQLPITIKYSTPETLGKDRLAGAVGGEYIFPGKNLLIIDAGTCIKFDFVNNRKQYIGGAISPGISIRFLALNKFTDKLPLIEPDYISIPGLIGNSTEESILSGIINGVGAEVNGIIRKYEKIYPDLKVILSGGDSEFISKFVEREFVIEPDLVLKGLNLILEYNR
ncbi:MAG: type III pantothenate kinase [Bacteroidota bacterium]|nr:type III pantothenate kinase [Bacteroidota bacterium]